MSVFVFNEREGDFSFADLEPAKFAYHIWPSGVLTVLTEQGDGWKRVRDYSPCGWWDVSGTVYAEDPTKLPGSQGRAGEVEPSVQIF